MRVAIITPFLAGHKTRGIGIYANNLISELQKNENFQIIVSSLNQLPQNVDLYHFTYFDFYFPTLPIFKNKKTIVTIHDTIQLIFPNFFPSGIRGKINLFHQKIALKSVSAIITDSNASKKDIEKYLKIKTNNIYTIYLAAAEYFSANIEENFYKEIKDKYLLPDNYILYVGDGNWNKNLRKIIQMSLNINYPLVIVSQALMNFTIDKNNPWTRDLAEAKKLSNSSKNIKVFGNLTIKELAVFYRLAKCMVYPSYYEGFGLPVVEAMASGCPVICSNKGSLLEIAGNAVKFVDPYNQADIDSKVKQVIDNIPLQKELITKGKIQVKNFSWKKTALQTVDVYRKVINSST